MCACVINLKLNALVTGNTCFSNNLGLEYLCYLCVILNFVTKVQWDLGKSYCINIQAGNYKQSRLHTCNEICLWNKILYRFSSNPTCRECSRHFHFSFFYWGEKKTASKASLSQKCCIISHTIPFLLFPWQPTVQTKHRTSAASFHRDKLLKIKKKIIKIILSLFQG